MKPTFPIFILALACTGIQAGTVANDDFADRIVLGVGLPQTTVSVNLADASPEPLEPLQGFVDSDDNDTLHTAWWSWTASSTGWVELSVTGDHALGFVFEGAALDRLERRTATNAAAKEWPGLCYVEAGHTYHLCLAGDGVSSASLAEPNVSPEHPLTLNFSGSLPINISSWGIPPLSPSTLPQAAWFQGEKPPDEEGTWICPHDGVFVLEATTSQSLSWVQLHQPTLAYGPITTNTGSGVWFAFRAVAGEAVRIEADRPSLARGLQVFNLREIPLPSPASDEVAGPLPLQISRAVGSRLVAANQPLAYSGLWQDVWWTATADGPIAVRAAPGQLIDWVVQESPAGAVRVQRTFAGDASYFTATAGSRYRISGHPKALEAWQVTIESTTPVANDSWSTAQDAGPVDGPLQLGSIQLATTDATERQLFSLGATAPNLVVWGRWTCLAAGDYMLWQDSQFMPRKICTIVDGVPREIPVTYPVPGASALTAFPAAVGITYYFAFAATGTYPEQSNYFIPQWHWNVRPFTHYPGNTLERSLPSSREVRDNVHIPYPNTTVNWNWLCPRSGNYAFSTSGATLVFQAGMDPVSETSIALESSPLRGFSQFTAVAGMTYILRQTSGTNSQYDIKIRPCDYLPPNTAAAAVDLGSALAVHALARDARPGHGLWWKWTAPVTGVYTIPLSSMLYQRLVHVSLPDETLVVAPLLLIKDGDSKLQVLEATAGQQYYFSMNPSANGTGMVELRLHQALVQHPANDDFANAVVLRSERGVAWSGPGHGHVVRWQSMSEFPLSIEEINISSLEPGEPAHASNVLDPSPAMGSLWWRWTATRTESVGVYGLGSCPQIYTGSALASLTPVSAQLDPEGGYLFDAVAGTTYHIAAVRDRQLPTAGYSSNPEPNTLRFFIYPSSATSTDAFADRLPVIATGYSNWPLSYFFQPPGTPSALATLEPGEPTPPTNYGQPMPSRWFTWHCEKTGYYRFYENSYAFQGRIYTGDSLATLVEIPWTDNGEFPALAGHDYILARYSATTEATADDGFLAPYHHHPYRAWIEQFSWNNESDLAMTSNPTQDGVSNLIKFLCGLNPNLPITEDPNRDQAPQFQRNELGQMEYRFRFETGNLSLVGSCYHGQAQLQRSTNLTNWEDTTAATFLGDDGYMHVVPDPPSDGNSIYYRMKFFVTYDP
jgi:hypothetical protein